VVHIDRDPENNNVNNLKIMDKEEYFKDYYKR
jgi:hypothetical protein